MLSAVLLQHHDVTPNPAEVQKKELTCGGVPKTRVPSVDSSLQGFRIWGSYIGVALFRDATSSRLETLLKLMPAGP